MDRLMSSAELASELGTTVPRIHRAVRHGVIAPVPSASNRLRFRRRAVSVLRARWGWTPPEATREEALVLAALSRRPLGLRSARAVARVAGISPTTAGRLLKKLEGRGIVVHQSERVVEGMIRDILIWTIAWCSPEWQRIAGDVGRTILPTPASRPPSNLVPRRLWHLFWDTDPAALRLDRHGSYVVDRVLRMNDLPALAWIAGAVPASTLRLAAKRRGLSRTQRRLALLMADAK